VSWWLGEKWEQIKDAEANLGLKANVEWLDKRLKALEQQMAASQKSTGADVDGQ
jgi:hypothetical protein